MKEIEMSKVLNLAKSQKYEVTCATFDLVDHIFKVDVPRSMKSRKLAVQSMSLIADGHIQFDYESDHPGQELKAPIKSKESEESEKSEEE